MVLVIGRLYNDRLGGYTQAILAAPCSLGERTGNYAVALYQDRTSTIVGGREIYGWPKKDAICATALGGLPGSTSISFPWPSKSRSR